MNNRVSTPCVLEKDIQKRGNIVVRTMIHKVVQKNPWNIQPRLDVLFHPARDEDTKKNERVFVEEGERAVDKLLDLVFISALIQAVDDDEEWVTCQRSNWATSRSSFQRPID
ncbi:hypothetical protein H1R20_g3055, partial [Candolleomyces eurysporus]